MLAALLGERAEESFGDGFSVLFRKSENVRVPCQVNPAYSYTGVSIVQIGAALFPHYSL